MCFIYKEDALDICSVWYFEFVVLFLKLLNIDNRNFWFTVRSAHSAITAEIIHQFLATLSRKHHQSATSKLAHSLLHQTDSVNNKVETCYRITLSKEIGKHLDSEIRQCSFATSLCMPNSTGVDTVVKITTDSFGCKELWITHHMLLKSSNSFAFVVLRCTLYISKTIL